MRSIGVCALFVFCCNLLIAQNLVPNPSFECGDDYCNANTTPGLVRACLWNCPTYSTPDIFTTQLQNKACYSSVPYDGTNPYYHYGSQLPRTGNRFAGIYTWDEPVKDLYREYLQIKLQTPLIPGEYYCTEMYVSLAEIPHYGANNLGMYFSDQEIQDVQFGSYANLPYTPQIVETKIIMDTVNWVRVSGTFQATTAAQYLIIGNFSNDTDTQSIFDGPNNDHYYGYAYYFIDDVSVEKLPYKNFIFSGNQDICEGDTTTIFANAGVPDVTWAALMDTSTIIHIGYSLKTKPLVTTSYQVKATNCHLKLVDTVTVFVNPLPQVSLGKDTTICAGATLVLDAGPGFSQYDWQDNSTSELLIAREAGKYSVTVKDQHGCNASSTISISLMTMPKVNLGGDTLLCNSFFPLKAGLHGASYRWQDSSTDSVFLPTKAGKYWVVVTYRCGTASDTINIHSMNDIFIPNVLTLNGDNLNEKFIIKGIGDNYYPRLTIVNRWGTEVYFSNNYRGEWPNQNQWPDAGAYYYTVNFVGCQSYKGWLEIFR